MPEPSLQTTCAAFIPTPSTTAAPVFLLDIFSRDSALVEACRAVGIHSCGISWFNTASPSSCNVQLNLALPWAQKLVLQTIQCTKALITAWVSPPCGTLSKARNRPMPASLIQAGVPQAPRLRSCEELWGLPSALACPSSAAKIFEANILVEFVFAIVRTAIQAEKDWVVINPKGSFIWDFPAWRSIAFVEFECHKCTFGGARPAPLIFRTSISALQAVAKKCDGKHTHLPWRPVFEGAIFKAFTNRQQAALPVAFCTEVAETILARKRGSATRELADFSATREKRRVPASPLDSAGMPAVLCLAARVQLAYSDENKRKVARTAAAAGRQARGKRVDRLIPEYKNTVQVLVPAELAVPLAKRKRLQAPLPIDGAVVPKDAQVLENVARGEPSGASPMMHDVEFGVPWSAEEFTTLASQLKHPYAALAVSHEIASAVASCAIEGPTAISRKRKAYLDKWTARGVELLEKEAALVESLHEDIQPFARKKRVLLFSEMLEEAGFPAAKLCLQFLKQGVPMFGEMPQSDVFPKRIHEASLTKDEVLKASKWAVPAMVGTKLKDPNAKAQQDLWEITEEERRLGECRGPFSKSQMDAKHPNGWSAAPRFPVQQKSKVRPCDNYSLYGHNGTSADSETIDTEGPDSISGLAKIWTRIFEVDAEFRFRIQLDDGSVLTGTLHPELRSLDAQALLGRLIDLARAYKQLARDPKDSDIANFCLPYLTGSGMAFFESIALGFGARNAVKGFNLFARGLRCLIVVGLVCPTTHFFDDFTHIDALPFSSDSCAAVEALFKLLGWDYKDTPEDLKSPSSEFSPLGVEVDLSVKGTAVIGNTAKRKDKIIAAIEGMKEQTDPHPRDIQSLVGVCIYAESQTAGRSGSLILRQLRNSTGGQRERRNRILDELRAHVLASKPRIVNLRANARPVIILTDAAADHKGATFGAVCLDHATGVFEFFAGTFSAEQVKRWSVEVSARLSNGAAPDDAAGARRVEAVQRQVICQAELAVVPLALQTWSAVVAHRDVLSFIDNDPAKDALILGSSRSEWSALAVRRTRLLCAELAAAVWYERVPSPSNIADWPSRGDIERLLALGAKRVAPRPVSDFTLEFSDL